MTIDRQGPIEATWPKGIGAPARRALDDIGIRSVEDLSRWTEPEISMLHGMGPVALDILRRELRVRGLSFAPE